MSVGRNFGSGQLRHGEVAKARIGREKSVSARGEISASGRAIRESFFTLTLKVITDSGPTAPITPLCRSSIFLLSRARAPSKAPFAGGRAAIARTTGKDACLPAIARKPKSCWLTAELKMLRLSRYTDTDLDPYGAHHGLFWTHIGWMLVKPSVKPGYADVRDLNRNEVVQWQHRWYFPLALVAGLILPWATSGYLWGDWRGGFYYVCFLRLLCVHHVSKPPSVRSTSPWPPSANTYRSLAFPSPLSASIQSRTTWERRHTMTSTPLVITSSPPS